jgi:surface protein
VVGYLQSNENEAYVWQHNPFQPRCVVLGHIKSSTTKRMFFRVRAFNQPIDTWDTSRVITMENMFDGAESFNHDLSVWNIGNVHTMRHMFHNARNFNHDVTSWGWNPTEVFELWPW